MRHKALEADRIIGVETGGCPHAAIREDISLNLNALEDLMIRFACDIDLLFVESGGDNLAAHFSKELVDYAIYVIDVSAGDKIPRKGGPGITQSDLLVINKTDLDESYWRRSGDYGAGCKEDARRWSHDFCLSQTRIWS